MLRPIFDIRIKASDGQVMAFDYVHDVDVMRSWQEQTATARITLPRRIKALKAGPLNTLIQVGDEVVVRLGYGVQLAEEFSGYVAAVSSKAPVVIECEDLMWKLKRAMVTKAYKSVTLSALLKDILPAGVEFEAASVDLGPFRISKASVAKVLEELKRVYVLHSYVRGKKLYVGLSYPPQWAADANRLARFHFQKDIISDALNFRGKQDVRLKVHAISLLPNNKKVKAEVGDSDGEERTLHFYGITSEAALKARATAEMDKLRYDGYRGDFTCFGFPYVDHGYTVHLTDAEYPERGGRYLVDKVQVRSGVSGYRRTITLGPKASGL